MHTALKIFGVSLLLATAACQPTGLYDQHGNYHSAETGYQGEKAQETNATDGAGGEAVVYRFHRPGFYDAAGNFVTADNAPAVPDDFLPPAGMCRIYHPDQPFSVQSPAKPCKARYAIASGAYVIYGGNDY